MRALHPSFRRGSVPRSSERTCALNIRRASEMPWARLYYFFCTPDKARLHRAWESGRRAAGRRVKIVARIGGADGSEFRHRGFGLAATRQLGSAAQIPDRTGARDDE